MQWRIERSMSSTPAEPGRTAPFVGVDTRQRNEEEALVAYDIMGSCYDLDSETGCSGSIASGGPGRTSQFVGVDIENRDGEEVIVVYDGMGACYDLDPETGKLSNPVLTK